jgi:hypothetical protein
MSWHGIVAVMFGCLLSLPFSMSGQAPPSAGESKAATSAAQHYPEEAYLSATRYTNGFFGFSLELPADAHLDPVAEPVAHDERIQLLELGGPAPVNAEISIVAFPPRREGPDAKTRLRKALDQELFRGVEELRGLSKTMLAEHPFYFYETRRGIDQHMLAAANLDGYVVMLELGARNGKTVKDLETCLQHVVFFVPAQVQQYIAADAQPYEGPAISSHRRAQLQSDPPKDHIDPGKIEGNVYRNSALGFTYQVPEGWFPQPQGAVLPAIERSRGKDVLAGVIDGGAWDVDSSERQLMKACSRTLFSVWAKLPGADGQIPYDDFGEITLAATAADCFPSVKFPSDPNDRQQLRDFLLMLGLSHPILRDMRDARAVISHGVLFLLLRGAVGFQPSDDRLSRRLSVAMAVTERRGYLLTWFFAAPHDSELEPLLKEKGTFDPEPASENATKAGSKEAPGKQNAKAASTAANSAASSTSSNTGTSASLPGGGATADSSASATTSGQNGASSGTGSSSQGQNDPTSAPQATRPSLLRPGETMENQQGNSPPAKKH